MSMLGTVLTFDIETVPDVEGGRKLYDLQDLPDEDVARAMTHLRLQSRGTDFMPLHLHRIVAISVSLRHKDAFKVWSIGEEDSGEADLIQRFYDGIERFDPTLVSWNGGGFDLPVLHYRGLVHGVTAPAYWEMGENNREAKWNNYIGRYQLKHTDLMDLLALYQPKNNAPLQDMAILCGLPGKMGMHGSKVWDVFLGGDIAGIRDYCETDVLNTWLMYVNFCRMRGSIDQTGYEQECELVKQTLKDSEAPHMQEFLSIWESP